MENKPREENESNRKPYTPPKIESEGVIESLTLACTFSTDFCLQSSGSISTGR